MILLISQYLHLLLFRDDMKVELFGGGTPCSASRKGYTLFDYIRLFINI